MLMSKIPKYNLNKLFFIALLFSVLLNIIFIIDSYKRNIVVSVPDGDSLQLADGRRVRLLGIDAPEQGRCLASEARVRLTNLAQGYHVRLKDTITDDYGRILANVIIENPREWLRYMKYWFNRKIGISDNYIPQAYVSRALVGEGLAKFEGVSSPYKEILKNAQELAKSKKIGIWSDLCRPNKPPKTECDIKGNLRAGQKKYYLPACRYYGQVIVDLSYGDVWFCSEKEAQDEGFINTCKL